MRNWCHLKKRIWNFATTDLGLLYSSRFCHLGKGDGTRQWDGSPLLKFVGIIQAISPSAL